MGKSLCGQHGWARSIPSPCLLDARRVPFSNSLWQMKMPPPYPKQTYISSGLDEAGVGRYHTYLRTMELDHCLVQVENDGYWDWSDSSGNVEKWTESGVLNGIVSSPVVEHAPPCRSPGCGKLCSKSGVRSTVLTNFISGTWKEMRI